MGTTVDTGGTTDRTAIALGNENGALRSEVEFLQTMLDEVNESRDGLVAALTRERRRVRKLRRAVLAWAERWHGELATDAARCADECDVRHSDAWRDESKRHARIAYSFGDRARDRSHDDD